MYKCRALVLMLLAMAGTACATTAREDAVRPSAERQTPAESYVWYDGDQPRRVWLDPELMAEFDGGRSSGSAVRKAMPKATEVPSRQAGVRLWRVPENSAVAARNVRTAGGKAKVSPVLRDAPGRDAPMRALPGDVIVHLVPAWEEKKARDWLERENLEVVRKLDFGKNVFVVKSEPGLAALELANQLRERDVVIAAMPDWWEQVEKR